MKNSNLVNFRVGISQLDGDVSFQFVLESDSHHPGQGTHHSGLSVGHMANSTDVDCCLKIEKGKYIYVHTSGTDNSLSIHNTFKSIDKWIKWAVYGLRTFFM